MQKLSYSNSLNSDDKRVLKEWKKVDSSCSEDQLSEILFHTSVENSFDEEAKNIAFNRFLTQIQHEENTVKKDRIISLGFVSKVAAAALVIIMTWFGFEAMKGEEFTYATGAEKESFILPDGSQITLNSQSELIYVDKWLGDREAKLVRGKGMFDIARDESKPFLVYFNDGMVKVLGTEFVVDLEDKDETSVTVREGEVSFIANNSRVRLSAKEKGVYDKRTKQLVPKKRRSLKDFDWLSDESPELLHVTYSMFIDQLEDDLNIVIQDGSVGEKFKACDLVFNINNNPDAVIRLLNTEFNLTTQLSNDGKLWILSGGDFRRCR